MLLMKAPLGFYQREVSHVVAIDEQNLYSDFNQENCAYVLNKFNSMIKHT